MPKTKIKSIILFTAMVLVVSGCSSQLKIKNEELGIKDSGEMGGLVEQVEEAKQGEQAMTTEEDNILEGSHFNCDGVDEPDAAEVKSMIGNNDWLTYQNSKYGIEVSYPKKYTSKDWSNCFHNWDMELSIGVNTDIDNIGAIVLIGIEKNTNKFDPESIFFPIPREELIINDATIGRGRYAAKEVRFSVDKEEEGKIERHTFFVEQNNKLFWIDVMPENVPGEKYGDILDTINFF